MRNIITLTEDDLALIVADFIRNKLNIKITSKFVNFRVDEKGIKEVVIDMPVSTDL